MLPTTPTKGRFLTNERLLKEAEKQHVWSEKSAAGGRASALKRSEKNQDSKGGSKMVQPNGSIAIASSSSKETPAPFPEWLPQKEWADFLDSRRKLKSPMTSRAEQLAVAELARLKAQGYDPKLVIEQSIMRGWKGLFAIKQDDERVKSPSSGPTPRRNVNVM